MANPSYDPDLTPLLATADHDDLIVLIDHITDKGEGRVSLSSEVCKVMVDAKAAGHVNSAVRTLIGDELRRFAGNTVANFLRSGSGVPYKEGVTDVAEHVKVNFNKASSCANIEVAISSKMLEQSFEKMSPAEREKLFKHFGATYMSGSGPATMAALQAAIAASGIGAYRVSMVVANSVAMALLGRGLVIGGNAALARAIGVFAGPIGWAVTAIWTLFDLGSPAYRVTVPCVLQIAYMRQKAALRSCTNCGSHVEEGKKFCGECGTPVSKLLALPSES